MKRLLALSFLILLTASGAIALDGPAPFGRLALSLGYPSLAAPLLDDPFWKGVAFYRQGRYEEAVAALRAAGPAGYYNRGNALARIGRFNEAIEVYDAHIYRAPHDDDAHVNRTLIVDLAGVVGEGRLADAGMTDAHWWRGSRLKKPKRSTRWPRPGTAGGKTAADPSRIKP